MAREGAYYRLYQAQARQAEADAEAAASAGGEDVAAVA
jgi:ATP-binding cassette subfamily B protein